MGPRSKSAGAVLVTTLNGLFASDGMVYMGSYEQNLAQALLLCSLATLYPWLLKIIILILSILNQYQKNLGIHDEYPWEETEQILYL